MLSLNVHVRQVLGEWQVSAILVESFGEGLSPEVSTDSYTMPLTEREWDSDALTATLSALARWSGRAIAEVSAID
jgi:hypothetical protein